MSTPQAWPGAVDAPRRRSTLDGYAGLNLLVGDLHNHCGISYGHGTMADAWLNARTQLDFASVTGHAQWHDMADTPGLDAEAIAYHRDGFAKLAARWGEAQEQTEDAQRPGFVSFLSYEWHSSRYGDHCVYFPGARGPLVYADSLPQLRQRLASVGEAFVLPHHLGYEPGFRGASWPDFDAKLTPVVEIVSMHGASDDSGARPYLHTMGPNDGRSSYLAGLRAGHRFGFIGSTDHHSAHPGSHGYGRAAVWAEELSREAIWAAIRQRRTYAVTGDRILLATTLNGCPMGAVSPPAHTRELDIEVVGADTVTAVEVLRGGEIIEVLRPQSLTIADGFRGVLGVTLGWGPPGRDVPWDVTVRVTDGHLLGVEPRLHGHDVVDPLLGGDAECAFSTVRREGDGVRLTTRTFGNPTPRTDATQGLALEVEGGPRCAVHLSGEGWEVCASAAELLDGPRTFHVLGAAQPAVQLNQAVPDASRRVRTTVTDRARGGAWYLVRVHQRNDQHAWSSPHWI